MATKQIGSKTVVMTPEEEQAHIAQQAADAAARDAWMADEANREVTAISTNRRDRLVADALFEIAKAANTGNWSAFQLADGTPVTSRALFYDWLRERY